MRTLFAALIVALGLAHAATAQSLADLASAEAARRATVAKPARVYTNKDLLDPPRDAGEAAADTRPVPDTAGPLPAAQPITSGQGTRDAALTPRRVTPAGRTRAPAAKTPAASDIRGATARTALTAAPKDEAYWKNRMRALELKLGSDIAAGDAARQRHLKLLDAQLEGLSSVQLKTLAADIQKATDELNRWTAAVQKDTSAIKALEGEAKQANIPSERLRASAPPKAVD